MSPNHFEISFIIVHYGHGGEVFKCLKKLQVIKNKFKSSEFILVDNNEEQTEKKEIQKKYPWIKYITKQKNLGWGAGRNYGLKYASGKYFISIDSDILISYKSFKNIYEIISKNKNIGMVSPRIKNFSGKYTPEATTEMTPFIGILFLSVLYKFFPTNFVVKKFLIKNWNRKTSRFVDVGQLGGFIMKRSVYEEIGKFDENLFLYFEENDIGKRLEKHGSKIYFDAKSEVIHLESKGTPKSSEYIQEVFRKSRMHYFKKHYGTLSMLLVEFFARISKENVLIFLILILGTFLRFYKIIPNAIFNGEMGTDYLNVTKMLDGTRSIWIGPRTSHEWFFIPPIAYWIYAILFKIFGTSPLVINIFWGVAGIVAIYICYFYVKKLFDSKVAIISAFLLAISPLWISMTRDARYNAPAAILFFPYLYYLKRSIDNNGKSLFILGLILGLMMSFFPSPILLIPAVIISFLFFKVKPSLKNVLFGVLGFIIPNIFYLFNLESIKNIILWIPYRFAGSVGLYPKNTLSIEIVIKNFQTFFNFIYANFLPNIN